MKSAASRTSRPVSGSTGNPRSRAAAFRREFREWRASLPTALERDTLLMPDVVAEDTVAEAARYLGADMPETYAERLASKAEYLYGRHAAFHRSLKGSGNHAPAQLRVYFRHWLCAWLKRERPALHRRLPWEYALGHRPPPSPPPSPPHSFGGSPKWARHAA